MIGIYCIENIKNKKKYVGQSIDIDYRLKKHFTKLRNGYHENRYLQRSFNKYGEESFTKYVLEECHKEELNEKEKFWIREMNSFEDGFNLTIGGEGVNGWKSDTKFKMKMRELVSGEKNPNYGNHWTDEMKRKLSEQRKGIYINENNPNAKKIICVETLNVYNTIKDASIDCNCKTESSISRCLRDKHNIANGFHFVLYTKEIYEYLLEHRFEYLCECYKSKNYIADYHNEKIYRKYELKNKIKSKCSLTTRELDKLMKNNQFEINNVQYVLL